MSHEPFGNLRFIHSSCAPKPNPELHHFPLEVYVGKSAKIGFTVLTNPPEQEYMWIQVTGFRDGSRILIGILDNDPIQYVGFHCGDLVEFQVNRIITLLP